MNRQRVSVRIESNDLNSLPGIVAIFISKAFLVDVMNSRRKFLVGTATVGTASIAGCAGLGTSSTLSWEEAFQKHLTDDDASVLEPTPIGVDSVTSEAEVKTSLAVLGWTRSGKDVSTETLAQMDGFATTATDLQETISPVLTRLNDVIDLIDDMKETSVLGTSVWDALVSAKPPLAGFDAVARELQTLLEEVSNRLGDIETATGDTSTQVEKIQSQGTTNFDSLPQVVQSLVDVTGNLITDIQDVIDQMTEVEELTSEATDAANDLPALGNEVSNTFGSLNTEVTTVRQDFEEIQTEIEDLQSAGENLQATAANEANQRYSPISKDATGSSEEMVITQINTDIKAYESE
jgi:vacuolar-type H+-ATPase subunit I/STV1